MAFTFIASTAGADGGGGAVTSTDAAGALNVATADVLVAWCKHEGTNTTFAFADTGGGNTFTFDAGDETNHSNGDLNSSFGYVLAATADASFTGRMTVGAARPYHSFCLFQFRPDAGETIAKDGSNTGQGTSASLATGSIATSGDDVIILGGYGEYTGTLSTAHQLNGVNATAVVQTSVVAGANNAAAWYRILTATAAAATATCTVGSSAWTGGVIAIKSTAAGGGGSVVPVLMRQYRQRWS